MSNTRLDGEVAIVSGGARGFGRAIAQQLSQSGASVAILDIADDADGESASSKQLQATVDELHADGARVIGVPCDVTNEQSVQRAVTEVEASLGDISIVVANAGVASMGKLWEIEEEAWDRNIDVNLKGSWLLVKHAVPKMILGRKGKIVFTASRNGLRAEYGFGPYNAAKAGVIHLMKSFALELGPYGINCNAVCPTQMADKSTSTPPTTMGTPEYWAQTVGKPDATYEEFDIASGNENLFSWLGQPDFQDVARAAVWLCTAEAKLITGVALPVDAGYIAKRGG